MLRYLVVLFSIFFIGCSGSKSSLYHWDGEYQKSLYNYLNEEGDINEQISNLENSIKKAIDNNKKVPPGLYAHLGLLYNTIGNETAAKTYFQKEAEIYPYSKNYIVFLLNNKKGGKNEK